MDFALRGFCERIILGYKVKNIATQLRKIVTLNLCHGLRPSPQNGRRGFSGTSGSLQVILKNIFFPNFYLALRCFFV
jgi:hypothetical protein